MTLTRAEAIALASVTGGRLEALCQSASERRDTHWGPRITYSRKVFTPLTNMCRDTCGYCTFVQSPTSPHAQVMRPHEVLEVARRGERFGCKEMLFSLGEKPELKHEAAKRALAKLGHDRMTDYLCAMCAMVVAETSLIPHVNAGALKEQEIRSLRPVSASMGMMLESASRRLTKRGLPHFACPDKVPIQRIRTLERAGRQRVPFTTGILIGIGETWEERIDSLLIINEMYERYGHIQEVIVQNFRAKPGTAMANHPEPTLEEILRTLAVARLLLNPAISLQAPPNLAQEYGSYIAAGINDWGGVSPTTIDFINPEREWPEIDELSRATSALGYELRERLTVYPSYLKHKETYLSPEMASHVHGLARPDGLAAMQCT